MTQTEQRQRSSRAPAYFGCAAVAVVGLFFMIYFPSYRDAIAASKRDKTMKAMEARGSALHAYARDHGGFPRSLPASELGTDAWGHGLRYEGIECGLRVCSEFRLASSGGDGHYDHDSLASYKSEATFGFHPFPDIVYGDKGWIRYPAGTRQP